MNTVSRLVVALAALFFAVLALQFWIVPEQAAHLLGIEAVRASGLESLRADMGGLFLGLAALCAAGAWTRRRPAIVAAAVVLSAIVVGRLVGFAVAGHVALTEITIELVALVALALYARSLDVVAVPNEKHGVFALALAILGVVAVACAGLLMVPAVQQAIFDQAARKLTATANTAPLADDALRVAIAGTSAPLPSRARAKACVVVFAGGRWWVVDAGPESIENLVLWGIPMNKVGGVLLTHYHSDHIGELGELQLQTWAGGRPAPLDVYGGPGVDQVVNGFNEAYRQDQGYRTTHHGEKIMPSKTWGMIAHTIALRTPQKDGTAVVYQDSTLKITAIEVDHAPIEPAYAYRFDYKGRSVVVTGDLKKHQPLVAGARDADLLVSEALSRSMTRSLEHAASGNGRASTSAIMHDIQDYHISPEEVSDLANQAGVKHLAFYHLSPAPDGFLARRLFGNGVNKVRKGDWSISDDGSLYSMPLGSREVIVGRID